ncbi:amidohydrolase [Aliiroseovarius sp. PrR006]|uniref:amidohydrolase n=1 Tax=Aliiroseovarius sp. PrR006 TaxID=2706883 RepID=UPI00194245B6|nr:amidohydrolase [Aliiroseovarius sp. PrR006]
MSKITVFKAKKIVTMDPSRSEATHVAVQNGKIIAVGGADCASDLGECTLNDSLADAVLMPGFVEGHAHLMAGAMWKYAYTGFHDRVDPHGILHKGRTDIETVISELTKHERALSPDTPLVGWGFDPIFLPGERLNKGHLDAISTERPIAILYSNFHVMCVNSPALALAGFDEFTEVEGVVMGDNGHPTGELQEMAAMFPILHRLGIDFRSLAQSEQSLRDYGLVSRNAGVTTITDLYSTMTEDDLDEMIRITSEPNFPVRIVPAIGAAGADPEQTAAKAKAWSAKSTDRLRLGSVKLMTDGSIQGWTARVKAPGYVGGQPNGIWNTAPAEIFAMCEVFQREGLQMHIHVNGDEASEVALDALEAAKEKHPENNRRHILQHCQMMDYDQLKRCAEHGASVNMFSNHLWYFGDQHVALTIGEERAERMNAARTALDLGINLAIHSDAPVTPLAPLVTAWCAVNRETMSGRILGEDLQISVDEALYAITLGAAHSLHLEDEVGSIEVGKAADFAILDQNPYEVAPTELNKIAVLGTVLGGGVHRI